MTTRTQLRRFDIGELRASSRTPQGFLKVPGFATRTGVFPYIDGDGKTRYELRHPDDVFDPASMETLKYAPVTIEHPPDMLTPVNVKLFSVGHTTERVDKTDNKLDTDLIVESADGIRAVEQEGVRELSCGYTADIVEEEGVFNGAPYDFRQTNIRYNHLAMVKRGRAGPEIRMRLDSADAVMKAATNSGTESAVSDQDLNAVGEPSSKKIVLAGREVELPSDAADTIQDLLDRYDEMRARLAQMEDAMAKRVDVDINQKGVSPQVKVEQQSPDGRAASGKVGASAKADEEEEKDDAEGSEEQGGVKKNSRDADEEKKKDKEEEKDDEEEEKKKDFEGASPAAGGGSAMDPIARMKKDLEGMKKDAEEKEKKIDAMQAKLDNYASSSMGKDEKHGDRKDSTREEIKARVRLERQAEKLVSAEVSKKFDSMTDDEIRSAVITAKHPRAELKGKSSVYLQSRFDHLCESFEESDDFAETRKAAGRSFLGAPRQDSDREDAGEVDPAASRIKMIKSGRDEYKSDLAAKKK